MRLPSTRLRRSDTAGFNRWEQFMWWIIGILATIGSGIAFRMGYLWSLDRWDRKGASRAVLDSDLPPGAVGTICAVTWPAILFFRFLKKIIFPRGIESRFTREKRLTAVAEAARAFRKAQIEQANRILESQGFATLPHYYYETTTVRNDERIENLLKELTAGFGVEKS